MHFIGAVRYHKGPNIVCISRMKKKARHVQSAWPSRLEGALEQQKYPPTYTSCAFVELVHSPWKEAHEVVHKGIDGTKFVSRNNTKKYGANGSSKYSGSRVQEAPCLPPFNCRFIKDITWYSLLEKTSSSIMTKLEGPSSENLFAAVAELGCVPRFLSFASSYSRAGAGEWCARSCSVRISGFSADELMK